MTAGDDRKTGWLGLDVGGTTLKAGIVTGDGKVVRRSEIPLADASRVDALEAGLVGLAREVVGDETSGTVGIGIPGVFDETSGRVVWSPNIPSLAGYTRTQLEQVLGTTVAVENDASCAALGEAWVGAGRGAGDFLMITLGTGVGGGVIIGGELWRGHGGRAGEIGHVVVDPGGRACGCGARGCLETVASAGAIARAARERGIPGSVEDIAGRARAGSRAEVVLFEEAGRALGIACADWLNLVDIRRILVGGGMAPALDLLLPAIRDEVRERVYAMDPDALVVETGALGPVAGVVGAARLALLREGLRAEP